MAEETKNTLDENITPSEDTAVNENITPSEDSKIEENITLYEKLLKKQEASPEKEAICIDKEYFAYTDAVSEVDILAAAFEECNVTAGTLITLCMPDNAQKLFCVYALNKIGAIAYLAEPGMKAEELSDLMKKTGSECLVMMDSMLPDYREMLTEMDPGMVVVCSKADYFSFAKRKIRRIVAKEAATDCPKDAFYTTYKQMRRFGKEILTGKLDDTYDWPSAFEEVAPEPEKEEFVPKVKPEDTAVVFSVKDKDGKEEEVTVSSNDEARLPEFLQTLIRKEQVDDVK